MKTTAIKYRTHDWYDPEKGVPIHGIQIHHDGIWKNLAEDGKPLLFDEESQRGEKLKSLRLEERRRKAHSSHNERGDARRADA